MRSGFMNSYHAVLSPAGIWSMRSITPIPLGIPIESSFSTAGAAATVLAVGVPEFAPRRHAIADKLLQLLGFREATLCGAGIQELAIQADFEHPPLTRYESDFTDLCLEGREQLLRDPSSPQ